MIYWIFITIFWILILFAIYEVYEQLKSINNKLSQLLKEKDNSN